jgi:hypothetical protein
MQYTVRPCALPHCSFTSNLPLILALGVAAFMRLRPTYNVHGMTSPHTVPGSGITMVVLGMRCESFAHHVSVKRVGQDKQA